MRECREIGTLLGEQAERGRKVSKSFLMPRVIES